MTFIVCPNLAIDRVLTAAAVRPGELTRCRALVHQAGGKGANVARALAALRTSHEGPRDLLLGLGAGHTGRLFSELANDEGLTVELVVCPGETRISTVILSEDGCVTPLFERGPHITTQDEEALLSAAVARDPAPGEWAIVDGAEPPGARADFFARLSGKLQSVGYRVLVDAANEQLAQSLSAGPDLVKVNLAEACSAFGYRLDCSSDDRGLRAPAELESEGLELSRRLVAAGAREAIVTLGAAGAVGCVDGHEWRVATPPIAARNTVGSGDCFAAALLIALEAAEPTELALAAAAGAGAANAASELTGHLDVSLAQELAGLASVGARAVQPGFSRRA